MMIALTVLLLVFPFILIEAFFSGSEITFVSASRPKILRKAKEKNAHAVLVKQLLSHPETLFATTVVGTTLAISCTTTFATLFLLKHAEAHAEWVSLLVLTPMILIFGEYIPKMAGRANADAIIYRLALPLYYASYFLYPFTKLLGFYARVLKFIFGESSNKSFFLSREEIKASLPGSRGTDVTQSERDLIERILEFGKITVKEMLRPLIDVVAIEENEPLSEAVRMFSESGHSRLPVYSERIDRIIGVIQGFDCLKSSDLSKPVKEAMQQAFFVPESKPIEELLSELKSRPMAIVVNEYGGAEGIITMEDVMEELVGEIEDEFDEPDKLYRQINQNSYVVSARMEIYDIKEQLKINIPEDEDYQTLAGYLLKKMQKIPKKWDAIVIDGIEFVVQSSTDRSIGEVYIIIHDRSEGK